MPSAQKALPWIILSLALLVWGGLGYAWIGQKYFRKLPSSGRETVSPPASVTASASLPNQAETEGLAPLVLTGEAQFGVVLEADEKKLAVEVAGEERVFSLTPQTQIYLAQEQTDQTRTVEPVSWTLLAPGQMVILDLAEGGKVGLVTIMAIAAEP